MVQPPCSGLIAGRLSGLSAGLLQTSSQQLVEPAREDLWRRDSCSTAGQGMFRVHSPCRSSASSCGSGIFWGQLCSLIHKLIDLSRDGHRTGDTPPHRHTVLSSMDPRCYLGQRSCGILRLRQRLNSSSGQLCIGDYGPRSAERDMAFRRVTIVLSAVKLRSPSNTFC